MRRVMENQSNEKRVISKDLCIERLYQLHDFILNLHLEKSFEGIRFFYNSELYPIYAYQFKLGKYQLYLSQSTLESNFDICYINISSNDYSYWEIEYTDLFINEFGKISVSSCNFNREFIASREYELLFNEIEDMQAWISFQVRKEKQILSEFMIQLSKYNKFLYEL